MDVKGLGYVMRNIWKMVMIMRSIPDNLPYWIRVVFYSSADTGCFACDLGEGLSALEWFLTHLTLLAAVHVCLGHMLSMQPLYLRPTEAKMVASWEATASTELGQFLVTTITRAQYLVEWKDIVAVSIVFLERGWRGSGNGTRPCFTKRIMKTKQLWQVWNLRTLPGRYEDYQSQAVCWKAGSLLFCVPLWSRWTHGGKFRRWMATSGFKKIDTWLALLKVAAIWTRLPSFYRWGYFLEHNK